MSGVDIFGVFLNFLNYIKWLRAIGGVDMTLTWGDMKSSNLM
jgi:hypothetical protein